MLATARRALSGAQRRTFSSSVSRSYDVSKVILIGRLTKDAELRTSKHGKEYITYTVATSNFPPPAPNPDGSRRADTTTYHHIFSFNPQQNSYLKNLLKGTRVYAEAGFELRDFDSNTDGSSPSGQRQIFLRHEAIRVLSYPAGFSRESREFEESEE